MARIQRSRRGCFKRVVRETIMPETVYSESGRSPQKKMKMKQKTISEVPTVAKDISFRAIAGPFSPHRQGVGISRVDYHHIWIFINGIRLLRCNMREMKHGYSE
jgi:hypothetical protein